MIVNFETYGPFALDWEDDAHRWRANFWSEIEAQEKYEGLSSAIGCYVFCLRYNSNYVPWYVGQTINKQGFKGEVFESHKIDHYNELMEEKPRHKPYLMFFPLMTGEYWNFSKNRSQGKGQIEWLETTLIGMAYQANPDLRNSAKTKHFRSVYINGIMGEQDYGRKTNDARAAAKMFKLS